MVKEVRRQFREIDGIMEGKNTPEYSKCVEISTHAALREMILPGILAIVVPILTGFFIWGRSFRRTAKRSSFKWSSNGYNDG